ITVKVISSPWRGSEGVAVTVTPTAQLSPLPHRCSTTAVPPRQRLSHCHNRPRADRSTRPQCDQHCAPSQETSIGGSPTLNGHLPDGWNAGAFSTFGRRVCGYGVQDTRGHTESVELPGAQGHGVELDASDDPAVLAVDPFDELGRPRDRFGEVHQ